MLIVGEKHSGYTMLIVGPKVKNINWNIVLIIGEKQQREYSVNCMAEGEKY